MILSHATGLTKGGLTVGGIAKGVQTLWLDSGPTESLSLTHRTSTHFLTTHLSRLKTSPSPLNDFLCSVSEALKHLDLMLGLLGQCNRQSKLKEL